MYTVMWNIFFCIKSTVKRQIKAGGGLSFPGYGYSLQSTISGQKSTASHSNKFKQSLPKFHESVDVRANMAFGLHNLIRSLVKLHCYPRARDIQLYYALKKLLSVTQLFLKIDLLSGSLFESDFYATLASQISSVFLLPCFFSESLAKWHPSKRCTSLTLLISDYPFYDRSRF